MAALNIVKDGRTLDTLENFRWPFIVGGPADGQRVPAPSWRKEEIEIEGETYQRHRFLMVGAPARIGYFVWNQFPKESYEPHALHRRILNTHPELERLDDIVFETGGERKQDVQRRVDRDAKRDELERGSGPGGVGARPAEQGRMQDADDDDEGKKEQW